MFSIVLLIILRIELIVTARATVATRRTFVDEIIIIICRGFVSASNLDYVA